MSATSAVSTVSAISALSGAASATSAVVTGVASVASEISDASASLRESLKSQVETLRGKLEAANLKKNEAKLELKKWLQAFKKEHGHAPSMAEKQAAKPLFVAHKKVREI